MRRTVLPVVLLTSLGIAPLQLIAQDWVVSAGDANYQRVAGHDTYHNNGPGELALLSIQQGKVSVLDRVAVDHTIAGPPQATAITPDGQLAFVSAPVRYDASKAQEVPESFLQIVPIQHQHFGQPQRIALTAQPQGLAISPDGRHLLAGLVNGHVASFSIAGRDVRLQGELPLSTGRIAGVNFSHDGHTALVALRDEQGLAVLDVSADGIHDGKQRISTGVAPYALDISADGHWAIAGNVGLAGLVNHGWSTTGDLDSVSLIDVSHTPFHTVQYLPTPSLPEGVAISPDGHWVAVLSMNGSQLPSGNPGRHEQGVLQLFAIQQGQAHEVERISAGAGGQGLVFSQDSHTLLAQYTVDRKIAVFSLKDGHLHDTGQRISLRGGPDSIRSMPR